MNTWHHTCQCLLLQNNLHLHWLSAIPISQGCALLGGWKGNSQAGFITQSCNRRGDTYKINK